MALSCLARPIGVPFRFGGGLKVPRAPLYACAEHDPQVFSIRTGTARQRAELIPTVQIWCRSAHAWAMDLRRTRQFSEQRPPRGAAQAEEGRL